MNWLKRCALTLIFAAGCSQPTQDETGSVLTLGDLAQPSVCGPEPTWKDIQEVLGGSEIESVIRRRARLTGLLSWGALEQTNWSNTERAANSPICTVTLVDPTHVLTAGHCFLGHPGWPEVEGRRVTPEEAAEQMVVRFGFQVGGSVQEPNGKVAVAALEDRDIRGQDFAVLRIEQAVDRWHWLPSDVPTFNFDGIEEGTESELAIIQHPMGNEKKAATGHAKKVYYDELWHDVDTDNGSSGAAVFDRQSRIVALHTRGGCTEGGNVARIVFYTFAQSEDLLCLAARNEAYRRGDIDFATYMDKIGRNRAPWKGWWYQCSMVADRLFDAHVMGGGQADGGGTGVDGGTDGGTGVDGGTDGGTGVDGGTDGGTGVDGGTGGSDAELCSQLRESVRQRVSPEAFAQALRNNWAPVFWSCAPPLDQQSFTFADCSYAIQQRCGGPNR